MIHNNIINVILWLPESTEYLILKSKVYGDCINDVSIESLLDNSDVDTKEYKSYEYYYEMTLDNLLRSQFRAHYDKGANRSEFKEDWFKDKFKEVLHEVVRDVLKC